MLAKEIKVGGLYVAKVAGNLTTVKVTAIRVGRGLKGNQTYYDVVNTRTNRATTFRSAAKFRREDNPKEQFSTVAHGGRVKMDPVEVEQRPDPSTVGVAQNAEPCSARTPTTSPLSGLASALREPDCTAPHLIIEALAGTGKTTTLVEGLRRVMCQTCGGRGIAKYPQADTIPYENKRCPDCYRITPSDQQRAIWDAMSLGGRPRTACFVAFNKAIAEELKSRVPPGVEAMTMHSMGYAAVRAAFGNVRANEWTTRDHIATVFGGNWSDLIKVKGMIGTLKAVEQLVGLCKQNLIDGNDESAVRTIANHHDVEMNGEADKVLAAIPKVLELSKTPKGRIDFDDMIFLPVILGLPVRQFDMLLVDEAQDLNRAQQALAKRAGRRLVFCGDRHQAIYGFAGADSESIPRLTRELSWTDDPDGSGHVIPTERGCTVLPLTVTRRCGKAIVEQARKYVPEFEAHESNGEGKISKARMPDKKVDRQDAYTKQAQPGDFVLCRVNAPLVSECFRFIRAGVKANIQGRDVGRGLIQTVEKLKAGSVTDLITKLAAWKDKEEAKENAKKFPSENKLTAIGDKHDCLMCFVDSADTVEAVVKKIEEVFTDDKVSPGIKLSSIHRSKGLEARRVFIIQRSLREDKMQPWELAQEENIRYVGITRAVEELIYVS